MKARTFYPFLLITVLLFTLSGCDLIQKEVSPVPTPIVHKAWTEFNFEIHSISAPGTDASLIFCDEDVMLVDSSGASDLQCIADYLKTKNISRLRYALYAFAPDDDLLSQIPAERVYAAESTQNPNVYPAVPGTALPLGESTITFSEGEHGIEVQATYRTSSHPISLDKSRKGAEYTGKPTATIIRISPDCVYKEIRYETLAESTPAPTSVAYIGNRNTGKLHVSACSFLPMEKNRIHFSSRDVVPNEQYTPCKKCMF